MEVDGHPLCKLINRHYEEWNPGIICHIFMIMFFEKMWNVVVSLICCDLNVANAWYKLSFPLF